VAARLVQRDPQLLLSRSWTTRARRPGEPADAYVFVDRPTFEAKVAAGGFLEHAEFLGNLYGTPVPAPHPQRDLLLEIDRQGAEQVRARFPDAVVVLLVPPSVEVQRQRLRGRGDDEAAVARRVAAGVEEVAALRRIADHEVVNDDVDRAVAELAGILEAHRHGVGPSRTDAPLGGP
jgi:guanylate kinase